LSADTALSIVIGSNGAPGSVEACLQAVAPQAEVAEVIVCEPVASDVEVRRRFPFARFLERGGAVVPELWREGIDAWTGSIVALTISPMSPAHDWAARIRARLAEDEVVAGAIEPGDGLRIRDWAEYFCRYARDMLPFERREHADIPGDNCAYRRELLERTRGLFRAGFWEPEVNRALRAEGVRLWHDPDIVVFQGRSAGFRAFFRQRLLHGRAYGCQRGGRFSTGRNVAGVGLACIVPVILVLRTAREVFSRGRLRGRFLVSLPMLLAFDLAWALGEARGHVDVLRER
jgi:hypothetical protein